MRGADPRARTTRPDSGGERLRRVPITSPTPARLAVVACLLLPRPQLAQVHEHGVAAHAHETATEEMAMPGEGEVRLPDESPLIRVRALDDGGMEIVVGPVALAAAGPHLRPQVQLAELPAAGWLHGFSWQMRDGDGNRLPDRLLHHVNVIDPDNRELFSAVPRRVLAAGRETKAEGMPGMIGVPIAPNTRVLVSAMFASDPETSFGEAYLHVALHLTPAGERRLGPWTVYPFYLDVMGPVGEKEFPLPPGTHGMSWEGSPAVDGRILAIGGHMHDFADWIRLEDVTAGEILWEARPEVDASGRTTGVPTSLPWWRGGLRLRKDRVYRIAVQYTNPLDRPAPDGGMGAVGGVILPSGDAWPAFDREHPDYLQDLRNTLEKPNEAAHAHGLPPASGGGT